MKIKKGEYGYIQKQKHRQIIITLVLFSVPLLLFFTGYIITETRLNWFTFIAVLGCLPASRSAVGMIMILMQKPVSKEVYEKIKQKEEGLVMIYDLVFTTYDKTIGVYSIVICGNTVAGYTSCEKADCLFIQKHIQEILRKNGYKVSVMIMNNLTQYLDRLSSIKGNKEELEAKAADFTPDAANTALSGNELIKHTLLAISL